MRRDGIAPYGISSKWKLEQAKEAYEWFDAQSDGIGVLNPS